MPWVRIPLGMSCQFFFCQQIFFCSFFPKERRRGKPGPASCGREEAPRGSHVEERGEDEREPTNPPFFSFPPFLSPFSPLLESSRKGEKKLEKGAQREEQRGPGKFSKAPPKIPSLFPPPPPPPPPPPSPFPLPCFLTVSGSSLASLQPTTYHQRGARLGHLRGALRPPL